MKVQRCRDHDNPDFDLVTCFFSDFFTPRSSSGCCTLNNQHSNINPSFFKQHNFKMLVFLLVSMKMTDCMHGRKSTIGVPGCVNEVDDVFDCVDVGQLFPTWRLRQHVKDDLPQR